MVTIALQIVTSSLRPYHTSLSLTKQDQTTKIGDLGELKVDAETDKFLTDLKVATKECNIEPSVPFIGLYNTPGVALALQAVPVNSLQAEFVIERLPLEGLHSVVVALHMGDSEALPPLQQQLAGFPLGYRYCGMATYPYMQQKIQIWQSQVR